MSSTKTIENLIHAYKMQRRIDEETIEREEMHIREEAKCTHMSGQAFVGSVNRIETARDRIHILSGVVRDLEAVLEKEGEINGKEK